MEAADRISNVSEYAQKNILCIVDAALYFLSIHTFNKALDLSCAPKNLADILGKPQKHFGESIYFFCTTNNASYA